MARSPARDELGLDELAAGLDAAQLREVLVWAAQCVAAQLAEDDPPEVYLTARRLLDSGYDRHEVLHMLAGAMAEQIHDALAGTGGYDRDRHLAALSALPESWQRQGHDVAPHPGNRAQRRARAKRRRR
jgi:hypothetical protein